MKKTAIIFGAAEVGQKSKKILENQGYQVLFFVDNNEKKWGSFLDGIEIKNPQMSINVDTDVIAIGVFKGFETVKSQLLEMGISEKKILEPVKCQRIFYNKDSHCSEENFIVKSDNPHVTNAYVIIWYLLLREEYFYNQILNPDVFFLKEKYFKQNVEKEMKKFNLNKSKGLNEIKKRVFERGEIPEFLKIGPSIEEFINKEGNRKICLLVLRALFELIKDYYIVVKWGKALDEKNMGISEKKQCIAEINFDMKGNKNGFLNMIYAICNQNSSDYDYTQNMNFLGQEDLNIHIQIKWQENKEKKTYESGRLDLYDCQIVYRTQEECERIKDILFNENTVAYFEHKKPDNDEIQLKMFIKEVKAQMKKNNIPLEKICVVGGSILESYGIRKGDDIDLIMTNDLRKLYGTGLVVVSDHVEFHKIDEFDISDHNIILDFTKYYVYLGLKFVSLDIVYKQRKKTGSKDSVLIEEYMGWKKS